MAKYNGHKNWNYWNVALWLANDERLYQLCRGSLHQNKYKAKAAWDIFYALAASQGTEHPKTPDGAPYSYSAIRAALVGW